MSSREVIENVQADLFAIQDLAYRDFQAKLMPTVNKENGPVRQYRMGTL